MPWCPVRRPRRGMRSTAVGLTAVALALTGCAVQSDDRASDRASRATALTTDVAFGEAAVGTASTGQGHEVGLEVSVGDLRPATDVAEAGTCGPSLRGGADQAVAVPVRVSATLRSSAAADVTVQLGNVDGLAGNGNLTLAGPTRWAVKFSETPPRCEDDATVVWRAMGPNSTDNWTAWLLVPGAITPKDPSGREAAGALVLSPIVVVAGQALTPQWDRGRGNVVACSASDPAAGLRGYIAIDTDQAQGRGCDAQAPTPGEQARSRACLAAYPGGAQESIDGMLVHNRASSLAMVCDGFAAPEGVAWTTAMTCFVIAVLADGSSEAGVVDALCKANDVIQEYAESDWMQATGEVGCVYLAQVVGGRAKLAVQVASGPAARVVGALASAAMEVPALACDAVFGGSSSKASEFGEWLENNHQANVASDISNKGMCLAVGNSNVEAVQCRN